MKGTLMSIAGKKINILPQKQDFGGMFYDHEVNFANQFVSASLISHMASNPAFFITGSMAEYHWPELWKLYDKYTYATQLSISLHLSTAPRATRGLPDKCT